MATQTNILAVAIIGKHGNPLYIRSFDKDSGPKWDFAAYASLDCFQERDLLIKNIDKYYGLLFSLEDHAIYGYQTNTQVKIILAVALVDAPLRDSHLKTVFRAIHKAYIGYLSNPFNYDPISDPYKTMSKPITSKKLQANIDAIVGYLE